MKEKPRIKQVGNFVQTKRKSPNRGRVYDASGIAPCVCAGAGEGGGLEIKIIVPIIQGYETSNST